MTEDQYAATRKIWALTHASHDLEQVCITCRFIIDNKLADKTPLYLSLLTAIYVTYAKGFKNKGIFRLSIDLVPARHKELHDSIIRMRDKAFAHTDRDGMPFADGYFVHDVGVRIQKDGACQMFISKMWARPLNVPNIFELASELGEICIQERDKLLIAHQHLIPSIEGNHIINVRDPSQDFSKMT